MRLVKLVQLLSLLIMVTLLSGTTHAALLDVGPTVTQVIPSTVPNLGHGYPLYYRDTNRVPLELCMNEAMCFFAPPNPALAVSFPGNIPDELFYWAGDATIPLASGGSAILVQAIEAAYSTGGVVPGAQITFARIRIRIDTNVAGGYLVTTPYKQFTFTVDNTPTAIAAGINFTEDIGIGADGVFTGALSGSIGPFLYCTDAPFPATDGSGGLYIGKNAAACPVQGSAFIPPGETTLANYFRVQGPANFGGVPSGLVQTTDFRVQGKLHTDVTPTPLTVDKAAYALDSRGMQVNVFATTEAVSNKTIPGAVFPLNFALTGQASSLQLSGTGIATQTLSTNNPPDGKFFSISSFFDPAGVTLPTTLTVTNTADVPVTAKTVGLVDGITITEASFNPTTSTLKVAAASADKLTASTLQVFQTDESVLPSKRVLLGTITGGQLSLAFPATLALPVFPDGPGGNKVYNIPPAAVTVVSSLGGAESSAVKVAVPAPAPVANDDTATTVTGTPVIINVIANDTPLNTINPASLAVNAPTGGTASANLDGTVTYTPPATPGGYNFTYTVKENTASPLTSNVATVTVTVAVPIPVAPTLVGPDGTVPTSTPAFTWNAVANAASYTLWNGNSGFTTYTAAAAGCPAGTGTCSATLATPLPAGTSVPWVVNATNPSGTSPFSATMHVTFTAPTIPVAPTLVGPNGLTATATPVFAWAAVPNAASYKLWNSNSGFSTYTAAAAGCPAGTGICSATLAAPLPAGATITWAVNATNALGTSPYSATMHVQTPTAEVTPVAPTLVGPDGIVATATPAFTWNAVSNATSYRLWNSNSGFTTYTAAAAGCPAGTGTCSATLAAPLPAGTAVTWAVNATNTAGTSPYSATMHVTFQ